MEEFIFTFVLPYLPNRAISRWVGRILNAKWPEFIRVFALKAFARMYGIKLEEAELPIDKYPTLGALFTRKLKPGIRPILSQWVHPVDGTLTHSGRIRNNMAIQVKRWDYPISTLLGEQSYAFDGGVYLTYYLSPKDYHRVHSPITGEITSIRHLQGQLWPVNARAVKNVKHLFCVNERLVFRFSTDLGDLALIMVGALNVGNMTVSFDDSFRTNLSGHREPILKRYDPPHEVMVGDELGIFHLGSTVVVLASAELARNYRDLRLAPVYLGAAVV